MSQTIDVEILIGRHDQHDQHDRQMQELIQLVHTLTQKVDRAMSKLDELIADIHAQDTLIDSAVTLINSIPSLIAAAAANAGIDPAVVQPVIDEVTAKSGALQAALTANTPAPAPTP